MAEVRSKAAIDPIFNADVTRLAETSAAIGGAPTGGAPRQWQTPPPNGWAGSHADIGGLIKPFDRDALNDTYAQSLADSGSPGTVGDMVAVVTQISYLGAMERGYRARHASPVRCLVHAAARRTGHGHERGVLRSGAIDHVVDTLAAGQS